MITLRLTEKDYCTLISMLGYTNGVMSQDGGIPQESKDLTDWVLLQGAPGNYTYFHNKETFRAEKEAELASESNRR